MLRFYDLYTSTNVLAFQMDISLTLVEVGGGRRSGVET